MSGTPQPPELVVAPTAIHPPGHVCAESRIPSSAVIGLLVLAVVAALYFARDVVVPIVLALILSVVFKPVVRSLTRLRIPVSLGAGIVVIALGAILIGAAYNLAEPAGAWLDKAPREFRAISVKLRHITGQIKSAARATEQVQAITQGMAPSDQSGQKVQEVTVRAPRLASAVLAAARRFALSAIGTFVLLYFLLASGDMFLRKIIAAMPRLADKKRAVDITRQIEADVSRYLLMVTIINTGLGCAVALALYLLGVPTPVLWGVMVGVFNFVPYLGDFASLVILSMVGLLTFDEVWRGALVPAAFYLVSATEAYLVTPLVLGRSLSLNPVVIVLSVLVWGWMWGMLGVLLAVPMLVVAKTFCDRVPPLHTVGEFLGA